MIIVRKVESDEKKVVNDIVTIHLNTFNGFFLTFMGKGFLRQMYRSYCKHKESGLLVAEENKKVIGFLSYSENFSGLYKFMIRTRLLSFGWYSVCAFFRRPSAFMHIIRAFLKPSEVKRNEKYVELSSIGVDPDNKSKGVGTLLIEGLKQLIDFTKFSYISLETDAVNNDDVIGFYQKNGFIKKRQFVTEEGRKMFEFRFIIRINSDR